MTEQICLSFRRECLKIIKYQWILHGSSVGIFSHVTYINQSYVREQRNRDISDRVGGPDWKPFGSRSECGEVQAS